jgi:hypothetical protein
LWHISNPVIYARCVYSSSVETAKKFARIDRITVYSSSVETAKKLARIDRITAIFSNVREHVGKGNTYVMVVYASPPVSGEWV